MAGIHLPLECATGTPSKFSDEGVKLITRGKLEKAGVVARTHLTGLSLSVYFGTMSLFNRSKLVYQRPQPFVRAVPLMKE
jgi:hypothetical protein